MYLQLHKAYFLKEIMTYILYISESTHKSPQGTELLQQSEKILNQYTSTV